MKKCLLTAVALLVFCVPLRADAEPVSPKPNQTEPREPHWQLFLDNHVITRSTGFQRVLHHPKPRGIVLRGDNPWETRGLTPTYVGWRKDGMMECYYMAHGSVRSNAYAISSDGINWTKPNLGLVEFRGSTNNNLIPCGNPRDMWQFGNVRDPDKHFSFSTNGWRIPAEVSFCRELPDFINDPNWENKIVNAGWRPSWANSLEFWDDSNQEWVAMRQAPNHPPVRCAGRYASPDLKNWNLKHFFYPDAHDSTDPRCFDEVYGLMATHVDGMVLGYVLWFHGDRTHPNPNLYEDGHERHTTEEGLIGKSVSKGTMEVRIAVSRDGACTWDRTVSREAWIPHGKEQDSYDRQVRLDCPPLRNGDEDWFYCSGYDGDHCSGAGYYHDRGTTRIRGTLYTQKHNRYVSLTAGNTNQILITKPLKVTGKTLQLNVDASRGEVKVGIGIDKTIVIFDTVATLPNYMVRDRQGRTHLEEGFCLKDCKPVRVNSIEHTVQFNSAKLEALAGKTVRLYIMVQDADLYGFRFK